MHSLLIHLMVRMYRKILKNHWFENVAIHTAVSTLGLVGYSGYSDIRQKPIRSNGKLAILGKIGFHLFEIIQMYLGIRRLFAHCSNANDVRIEFELVIS